MDMQRALRQEVASICHVVEAGECRRCARRRKHKQGEPAARAVPSGHALAVRDCLMLLLPLLHSPAAVPFWATKHPATHGKCVICDENAADSVFYSCGHMCVCHLCAHQLRVCPHRRCHRPPPHPAQTEHHTCPMCRSPIQDILRVFMI